MDARSHGMDVSRQNNYATKADWERYRNEITLLYEGKELKVVKRFMEKEYQFKATDKMYKTHFKEWGLVKNKKENEMRAVARKVKERSDQGKDSIIRLRGKIIDHAEVVRCCKRKGMSIEDFIAGPRRSPTPEDLKCFTPVLSRITIPEKILISIRDYHKGCFESGKWTSDERTSSHHLENFTSQCRMACELFKRSKIQEAGRIILHAFATINDIFSTELPATLSTLFQLAILFRDTGSPLTAFSLVQQCSQCFLHGELHKSEDHPLIRICAWLGSYRSLDSSQFQEVLARGLLCVGDNFEKSHGQIHQSTFSLRLQYIYSMSCGRNVDQGVIDFVENLATRYEQNFGREDTRTMIIRLALAYVHLATPKWSAAKRIAEEVVAHSSHRVRAQGVAIVAQSEYGLGYTYQAIVTMRVAIDSYTNLQEDIGTRFSLLLMLESWLLEDGIYCSADQVRKEIKGVQDSINAFRR